MRFMRIGDRGRERPLLLDTEGRTWDLTAIVDDIDPTFFASDGPRRVLAEHAAGRLTELGLGDARVGAPIARAASIICVGMNYAAHAAESGSAPPEHLVVFFKKPNTAVGPEDPIIVPRRATKLDWEVELAIVIGAEGRYLESDEDALAVIGGYALVNDLSERAFQIEVSGGQWSKGKNAEGFTPFGPWIATPDEVGDVQALSLRSWVNEQPRQSSSTADMIFPVARVVRELSAFMVLEPGDVILTGTPEGVALSGRFPYLRAGDRVRMSIDGLGEIDQIVVDPNESTGAEEQS
jgi:2-keto-4-pentenoate hydratase/2-oxohepta-3-ene-1,7-dioic acid hydratase in catechol pathway